MVKKILLTGVILAATASSAFAASPYVGAGIGINTNTSSAAPTNPANFRGVPFNVFLGYGGVIGQTFYLAGELDATVATAEISDNGGLKTTYGYGASILPGVMLSDNTIAFARLGIVRSRFSSQSESVTGGQLGLGLQTCLTQNIDIRGEYDFTAFKSFNANGSRIAAPRQDAFNLALVYKFD